MDNKERTPVQKAIEYFEKCSKATSDKKIAWVFEQVAKELTKNHLPYEKAFMEKVWEGGEMRQAEISHADKDDKLVAPDFPTYYSQYDK